MTLGVPTFAHRLDEYFQATIITLEKNRVDLFMRLVPGVAGAASVLASIDKNGDGAISGLEQRAYAEQVLRDLSITRDGIRLNPQLTSVTFTTVDAIHEGLGEIQFEFKRSTASGGYCEPHACRRKPSPKRHFGESGELPCATGPRPRGDGPES